MRNCKICNKDFIPPKSNALKGYGYYCSRQCYFKVPKPFRTHGLSRTRFYRIWYAMRSRCENQMHSEYKNYGGRGIKIEWRKFKDFALEMSELYFDHCKKYGVKNTTIDRINNDGNYCRENCRWATIKENCNNSRRVKKITFKNKTQSLKRWSEELGFSYATIQHRIQRGWPIDRALSTPQKIKQYYFSH